MERMQRPVRVRRHRFAAVHGLVALLAVPAVAAAQDRSAGASTATRGDIELRTPWGAPNLGGVWDFRTLTPLERPEVLGEKAVLTPEEAAAFRKQVLESRNADRRDGGAARDVERAYNDFWWDYGDSLTEDLRTSLIVDPPNGRIPQRVAGVDEADDARRAARRRPVRERVVFGSPAHGPEDLGLSERCMLGFNAGPPMLPSAYNNNIQILQTRDHVVILNEMIHDARIVPLGDKPHLPGSIRQWLGGLARALGGRHAGRRIDELHVADGQLLHRRPRLRLGRRPCGSSSASRARATTACVMSSPSMIRQRSPSRSPAWSRCSAATSRCSSTPATKATTA